MSRLSLSRLSLSWLSLSWLPLSRLSLSWLPLSRLSLAGLSRLGALGSLGKRRIRGDPAVRWKSIRCKGIVDGIQRLIQGIKCLS